MTSVSLHGRTSGFSTDSSRTGPVDRAQRVWDYRKMLWILVKRDVKLRYAGSALGYLWSVLEPLLMSFVYYIIFTKIFSRGDPRYTDPYIVFLLSGMLAWFWFNGTLTLSTKSLRSEAQMVRSSNVPRELWVLRSVLSKGIEFIFSLPVLVLFMLVYQTPVGWKIVFWPVAIVLECVLLTGLGLILSSIAALVRDVERIVPIVLRLMYFASPVLYSINQPRLHSVRPVYDVNPIAGILDMFRIGIFPKEGDLTRMLTSAALSFVILGIGVFVFARLERQVLKEI